MTQPCLSGFAGCYGRVAYPAGVQDASAVTSTDAVRACLEPKRQVSRPGSRTPEGLRRRGPALAVGRGAAPRTPTATPSWCAPSSRRGSAHPHPRTGVVDVPLRVPQRRLVLGLRGRRGVPRADEDLVLSGRELDHGAPVPPGPAAEVLEQLRLGPRRAAVDRDVDPGDVPLAPRERIATHLDRAGRDRLG